MKIEHLTKRFGDDTVLDDLSLDCAQGRGYRDRRTERLRQKYTAALCECAGGDPGRQRDAGGTAHQQKQ